MENDIHKLQKQYAALAYALGVARATLSTVIDRDFTAEEVQRVYDATAAVHIAKSIGLSEDALDVYWDEYLSDAEKHRIKGYDAA
jgi:type IV secretory pathway TrbF-like protein